MYSILRSCHIVHASIFSVMKVMSLSNILFWTVGFSSCSSNSLRLCRNAGGFNLHPAGLMGFPVVEASFDESVLPVSQELFILQNLSAFGSGTGGVSGLTSRFGFFRANLRFSGLISNFKPIYSFLGRQSQP